MRMFVLWRCFVWRKGRDLNPRWSHPHNGFQDRRIKPLCHPSALAAPRMRQTTGTPYRSARVEVKAIVRLPGRLPWGLLRAVLPLLESGLDFFCPG